METHRRGNRGLGETMSTEQKGGHETATSKVVPATGKLGVMVVGLGAVATTMIAGVEAVRRGLAKPIGSVTQMGTIRLGKRTENNFPLVKDFVPLADLKDLVFTGWDIFEDNVYESAAHAKVLDKETLEQLKPYLETIKPLPAVFDQYYVKRLNVTHVKKGKNKRDLADQLIADIRAFKKTVDRVVMIWCGSTEIFLEPNLIRIQIPTLLDNGKRYDFALVLPEQESSQRMKDRMREGLEDYFHVNVIRDSGVFDVYVLTVAEDGKLEAVKRRTNEGMGTYGSSSVSYVTRVGLDGVLAGTKAQPRSEEH